MRLTKSQKDRIDQIAQRYDLKMILLFGSQADGTARRDSDVDVAVLPEDNLTFEQELFLNTDLMNILGNVDMTNLRKASPLLMKQVVDNCQILYEKENTVFNTFELYTINRYVENKPLFEITDRVLANSIK